MKRVSPIQHLWTPAAKARRSATTSLWRRTHTRNPTPSWPAALWRATFSTWAIVLLEALRSRLLLSANPGSLLAERVYRFLSLCGARKRNGEGCAPRSNTNAPNTNRCIGAFVFRPPIAPQSFAPLGFLKRFPAPSLSHFSQIYEHDRYSRGIVFVGTAGRSRTEAGASWSAVRIRVLRASSRYPHLTRARIAGVRTPNPGAGKGDPFGARRK